MLVARDGRQVPIEVRSTFFELDGRPVGVLGLVADRTAKEDARGGAAAERRAGARRGGAVPGVLRVRPDRRGHRRRRRAVSRGEQRALRDPRLSEGRARREDLSGSHPSRRPRETISSWLRQTLAGERRSYDLAKRYLHPLGPRGVGAAERLARARGRRRAVVLHQPDSGHHRAASRPGGGGAERGTAGRGPAHRARRELGGRLRDRGDRHLAESSAACSRSTLARTEVKLEDLLERIHPDDHALLHEASERAQRTTADSDLEYRIVLADGTPPLDPCARGAPRGRRQGRREARHVAGHHRAQAGRAAARRGRASLPHARRAAAPRDVRAAARHDPTEHLCEPTGRADARLPGGGMADRSGSACENRPPGRPRPRPLCRRRAARDGHPGSRRVPLRHPRRAHRLGAGRDLSRRRRNRRRRRAGLPARHHRAQARRGGAGPARRAVPSGAEAGGGRPARRRHRPRLQQHAHRDQGVQRAAAQRARARHGRARRGGPDSARRRAGGRASGAAPRLRPRPAARAAAVRSQRAGRGHAACSSTCSARRSSWSWSRPPSRSSSASTRRGSRRPSSTSP